MAGHVYAVGGFNGSLRVRTVDVYDGVKDQWTSIASMQERRSTLGAAVLNDLLYAVGGFDGSTGRSRTQSPSSLGHSFHATLVWSAISWANRWFLCSYCPKSIPILPLPPACASEAHLPTHRIGNCPRAVISRALGRTPPSEEALFSFLVSVKPFIPEMRLRASSAGGCLRTVV